MKKHLLNLAFIFICFTAFSQGNVESLIEAGIKFHDQGEYQKAIETFKTALELEPNSAMVHYELALSYMYAKEYKKSMKHSDKVIAMGDKYLLEAYNAKASCLDYLGKTKESIKLFESAIKKFGDNYLLYYNLAYNYYNIKELDKAEETLIKAINTNPKHASSHLLLGYVMADKKQKVQSLLCLHYFLFMEPGSERAKTAYHLLQQQFGGNVKKDKDKPNQINIFFDPNQSDGEFGAADLMISMLEASKSIEKNEGKTEEELFIKNTGSFFSILGELKKRKNKGLWWEFYVPLFYDIAESEHIDTYCYHISQSSNKKAVSWLEASKEKIKSFDEWLKEQK